MKSAKLLTVHGPNVSVVVDYADTVRASLTTRTMLLKFDKISLAVKNVTYIR